MPLPSYLPCIEGSRCDRKSLVEKYFNQGYSNIEILAFLSLQHNVTISLSTLKRDLASLGLRRRQAANENRDEVRDVIQRELIGSGCNLGIYCYHQYFAYIFPLF